jgi:quercetin dioxygenase-like cupin family protein
MTHFYHPIDRETKELLPGIIARTFWGQNLMLAVVDLDAEALLPNHTHPHEQAGIVLEGELNFTIDGETRQLKPGDVYIIPGEVEHSVVVGNKSAKVLDVFSPVREEYKY